MASQPATAGGTLTTRADRHPKATGGPESITRIGANPVDDSRHQAHFGLLFFRGMRHQDCMIRGAL
jgi:hypothetical protein